MEILGHWCEEMLDDTTGVIKRYKSRMAKRIKTNK
jgi:hypothetical protein